ncbi:hypothetical protein EON83_27750 [bacterium]|nr:MAG: hypothetical protein EON83_27750 [bacterium]
MKHVRLLYSDFVSANKDAFEQGLYTMAYHALAGAMQCALHLQHKQLMAELQQLVIEQKMQIEAELQATASLPEFTSGNINEVAALANYRALETIIGIRLVLLQTNSN